MDLIARVFTSAASHVVLLLVVLPAFGAILVRLMRRAGFESVYYTAVTNAWTGLVLAAIMLGCFLSGAFTDPNEPLPQDRLVSSIQWHGELVPAETEVVEGRPKLVRIGPNVRVTVGVSGVSAWLIALTVAALAWLDLRPLPAPSLSQNEEKPAGSVARFDPGAVAREVATGRPAFVYFTADWCLTCKLNERVVLSDERIQQALAERDTAIFKGDWTLRDEAIRAELARFGRAGVPLYLLYDPAKPGKPQILPELLSVDLVLEALSDIQASESRTGPV